MLRNTVIGEKLIFRPIARHSGSNFCISAQEGRRDFVLGAKESQRSYFYTIICEYMPQSAQEQSYGPRSTCSVKRNIQVRGNFCILAQEGRRDFVLGGKELQRPCFYTILPEFMPLNAQEHGYWRKTDFSANREA